MMNKYKNQIVDKIIFVYPLLVSIISYYLIISSNDLTGVIIVGFLLYLPILILNSTTNLFFLVFYVANERLFIIEGFPIGLIALLIILLFIKTFIQDKMRINILMLFFILMFFLLMFLKGTLQTGNPIDPELIRHILNVFILLSIINKNKDKLHKFSLNIGTWFCYGVFIASFMGIYHFYLRTNEFFMSDIFRLIPVNQDPNYYGVAVSLAISVLIVKLSKSTVRNNKLTYLLILLFAFGFMTQSRAFIITSIVNLTLFLLLFIKPKKGIKLGLLITLGITLFIGIQLGFSQVLSRSIERFQYTGLEDIRLTLWKEYSEILTRNLNNFLFGIGKIYDFTSTGLAPHNFLIGSWAYYGFMITGTIILTYVIIIAKFKRVSRLKKWHFVSYLFFLVLILGYSFLDGIIDNLFIYGIIITLANIYIIEQRKKVK